MKKIGKVIGFLTATLVLIIILGAVFATISNHSLPKKSPVVETLSTEQKIRLAETQHLRQGIGSAVWPGFGDADIPAITYNEAYAFLMGYENPPDGWVKVPANKPRGIPWELVPADTFNGEAYYRQVLPDPEITPEGFTVLVGDRWTASLMTYEWGKISLAKPIREDLPTFLQPVFPYQIMIGQMLGSSDKYISLYIHETFHAFQGMNAPEKLAAAEFTNIDLGGLYPADDPALIAGWQTELDLLAEALRSTDQKETRSLVQQFLEARAARRKTAGLSAEMIALEQHREWLEGLARYAELEIWRQAAAGTYTPLEDTAGLTDFENYAEFDARWKQEITQLTMMADDDVDGRAYYSGMAQAVLLDRFSVDWKSAAFDQDIWLEDLLASAISQQGE